MDPKDLMQDRLRRLEAVVAALLVADRDIEFLDLRYLLRQGFGPRDDDFEHLLHRIAMTSRHPGAELRQTAERLEEGFAGMRADFDRHRDALTALHRESTRLQGDAHTVFAMLSLGLDLDSVPFHRYLPVRVYVDRHDPDAVAGLSEAVEQALQAFDLEVADDFWPLEGSWFKKWIWRSRKAITSDTAKDIGRKVARGVEIAGLEKPQADVTKTQAEALGILMERAKDFSNVAIQCGAALVVVTSDGEGQKNLVGVTLSAAQLIALENNQQLLYSPQTLLDELKRVCIGEGDADAGGLVR